MKRPLLASITLFYALLSCSLEGCVSALDPYGVNANIEGAHRPIANYVTFEKVDLISELVPGAFNDELPQGSIIPEYFAAQCVRSERKIPDTTFSQLDNSDNTRLRQCLAQAYLIFYKEHSGANDLVPARDRLQERLFAASVITCSRFEQHLNSYQSYTNFGLGGLTSLAAGAGAAVTGAVAARSLAGTAGVLSGVRAEYNADFFYKQTISVLIKAIDNWRKSEITEIRSKRSKAANNYNEYPVEAAVGDALAWNDGCSLVHALSLTSDAVSAQENPGIEQAKKVVEQLGFSLAIGDRKSPLSATPSTDASTPPKQ